jgi:hypothetical protein
VPNESLPAAEPRTVEGGPLPYLLSAPAAGEGETHSPIPLLCFLHGNDEAAPADLRTALTRQGPLRTENLSAIGNRFLVVAPQLPAAGDRWRLYAGPVRAIVEEVRAAHGGDPARTYLTGFSFGANGALDLGYLQPDCWAALWAVDPTRLPEGRVERPVWLSFGEVARFSRKRFIQALNLQPAEEDLEGDHLFLDQGQSHVGSARLAYRDERIYDWLLSKRLPL